MDRLLRLSRKTTDSLVDDISKNIGRYRTGDFSDLAAENGWEVPLGIEADLSALEELDPSGTPEAEIKNASLVWQSLGHLRPSVACDEQLWTRLTHVECLEFTRARWIEGQSEDEHEKLVRTHFFADTLNRRRDDNPISRAWWNAHIAEQIDPGSGLKPLEILLSKADLRSNIIERSRTAARVTLASGIVRAMEREAWLTQHENNWRAFMKTLNVTGGGVLFEALSDSRIDAIMDDCVANARLLIS